MFDFSDEGAKSALIGFQHQNEDLNRDIFLGNISPITGAFITGDMASYIYTGVIAQYKLGKINFTPSFTPGLYHKGNGKDLHSIIEFKTELIRIRVEDLTFEYTPGVPLLTRVNLSFQQRHGWSGVGWG